MKKIMFSERFGLEQAVLAGTKTMTRRIIPDIEIDWNRRGRVTLPVSGFEQGKLFMDVRSILHDAGICDYSAPAKYQPKYEKGEEVAVAQCYEDAILDVGEEEWNKLHKWYCIENLRSRAGLHNKMFVRPDLMPHRIRITGIKVERLQNISDEDCLREGVYKHNAAPDALGMDRYKFIAYAYNATPGENIKRWWFQTPREAFAALIDRISGRGTWQRNPWVYAYTFELIK
jgi:hypothetical protein